jgi:hypothetical protein
MTYAFQFPLLIIDPTLLRLFEMAAPPPRDMPRLREMNFLDTVKNPIVKPKSDAKNSYSTL